MKFQSASTITRTTEESPLRVLKNQSGWQIDRLRRPFAELIGFKFSGTLLNNPHNSAESAQQIQHS